MLKYILARLRWGPLSSEEREKLKSLSFRQTLNQSYLHSKLYKNY